jgi:membrane dipeptidase
MMKVVDLKTGLPKIDIGKETNFHIDIPKASVGGLNVAYFGAFSDYVGSDDISSIKANSKTLALLNALHWTVKNNVDTITIAKSVVEIKEAVLNRKIAAVPTIEGAYSLEKKNAIELLNQYYDVGVRVVGYVWNSPNALGSGTTGPIDMGLTELGYEVTKEMNRLGIIIDVSHMNEKTFWNVLKVSEAPMIASHSCVYSLRNHDRNLTDEQIIALADMGGVINLNYWPELLGETKDIIDIKKLVDHIDYIVNLVGIDYVGLGSDFDGTTMPNDIQSAAELPYITAELIERGYSTLDLSLIHI